MDCWVSGQAVWGNNVTKSGRGVSNHTTSPSKAALCGTIIYNLDLEN